MVRISTKQFAIVGEAPSEWEKVGMDLSFNVNYSIEMHCIGVSSLLVLKDKDDTKLLILELFCEFNIHPEDWSELVSEKKLTIKKGFLEYLISQTLGTLRGVAYCKTENTPYSAFVLPSVNVTEMVKTDAVFDLE